VTGIARASRQDETIKRWGAGGNGDNWHMTWAPDDTQFSALCDGAGFDDPPVATYNASLLRIQGDPLDLRFTQVAGYPHLVDDFADPALFDRARYYGFGTLAAGGHVYQYLSTFNTPLDLSGAAAGLTFNGAKLIYSADGGATWRNQDGTTPVSWPGWGERSRDTLVFFEEPQRAFSLITMLQMGQDYRANRDGYAYGYAPNGETDGTMNEMVLFRVPVGQLLDRSRYEFFQARNADGSARWTQDIQARGVVHTFPRGWVNVRSHPYAWHPSVVYDEPLDLYLMANWGMGTDGDMWFTRPSYLGLWWAATPWGPWEQFHEETVWTPAGDMAARAYQPQIAPKWIAADGRSFWLVWTDFQAPADRDPMKDLEEDIARFRQGQISFGEFQAHRSAMAPYYAFNAQCVDLTLRSHAR